MTTRIAVWSGPRNLSTALMRSWENRPDTVVLDEPLYAHYLAVTGLDHPGRDEIIAAGPVELTVAIARCLEPLPEGITISYQKHMSHHLLDGIDRSWLDGLRHVLLIRDPVQVLASYTRIRRQVSLDDIGLPQQLELAARADLIVDAGDFLLAPRRYTEALCDRLGVPFTERMLRWPPGRRASDGCWAEHWYASVESSTGFRPPPPASEITTVEQLPSRLRTLAAEANEIYRELAADRLIV